MSSVLCSRVSKQSSLHCDGIFDRRVERKRMNSFHVCENHINSVLVKKKKKYSYSGLDSFGKKETTYPVTQPD